MGTIEIDGSTPKLTIGNATAEDALILFDGNAQDFHIGLDDTADDLVIGVGSALGTTTALAIDENAGSTFSGTVTVGVDDTGKDVKFFGASAGAYMEWDESADELRLMGASADATTSTGKLLLATSLTNINANDVLGKIDFQAPHEAGGTDAITVAASIRAVAQSTFSASSNATDLIFYTGHSEAAAEKIRITSQNEIGIAGANYGTDGQVLTSAGAGAAVAWDDAAGFDVSSITGATALATQPASTDEIVLSDAGSLKRLDIKHIQNTPAFAVYKSADQAISDTAYTKVAFNTEVYDSDGTYDNSTNYRFTPAVAGKYFLTTSIFARHTDGDDELHNLIVSFYKNGSIHSASASFSDGNNDGFSVCHTDTIDLDGDDYVEVYAFAQVATDTPVLEATTTSDGSRALGRGLTFGGFRVTGL